MSKNKIEDQAVFGCYSQSENKVTLALLKVLERAKGDALLRNLIEEADGEDLPDNNILLESQVTDTAEHSIPDGKISCQYAFQYFIESKLSEDIPAKQLQQHLETVRKTPNAHLVYITQHSQRPKELKEHNEVLWTNWTTVTKCLRDYEDDNNDPVLKYLIEQFELFVRSNNVYDDSENRVLIVGGNFAEDVALKYNFYACQANRSFRNTGYIAFLRKKKISYLFKIVGEVKDSVNLREEPGIVPPSYFDEVELDYQGTPHKLFKLERVEEFAGPIIDDSVDKNGKHCAFVQRQGYTTLDQFMNAKVTSDLRD